MIFDLTITLVGQPAAYWMTPMAANEGDPLVRYFMRQGLVPLLLISVVYAAVIVTLVSILPARIGLVLILCFTLWHYFGACTWLHFRFDMAYGAFVYGLLLSGLLVTFGLDNRPTLPPPT
ncbi:MAG: hypothetical protein JWL59_3676 [Chthoniobacteraceae bacterium]|nr:hypothetical protein [Chthoniobacteraceae bacterium]